MGAKTVVYKVTPEHHHRFELIFEQLRSDLLELARREEVRLYPVSWPFGHEFSPEMMRMHADAFGPDWQTEVPRLLADDDWHLHGLQELDHQRRVVGQLAERLIDSPLATGAGEPVVGRSIDVPTRTLVVGDVTISLQRARVQWTRLKSLLDARKKGSESAGWVTLSKPEHDRLRDFLSGKGIDASAVVERRDRKTRLAWKP